MNITSIKPITASQAGNVWTLTVVYTATFTNQEKDPPLNYVFRDSIRIYEEDPWPNPDDTVTGWVAASNFNPTTNSVVRTLRTQVSSGALDTEWFGEEIYAKIQLRNFTTGGVPLIRRTPIIHLNP